MEAPILVSNTLPSSADTNSVKFTGISSDAAGTFVFTPLEAKFFAGFDPHRRVDPYCKLRIGLHRGRNSAAFTPNIIKSIWSGDTVALHRHHREMFAKLKVKDENRLKQRDSLGKTKIPLDEVVAKGKVTQKVNIYKQGVVTGEILMDIEFIPRLK